MNKAFEIVPLVQQHWGSVRAIYAEGLATGVAAFRLTPPIWKQWDAGYLAVGRLVARSTEGDVLGWAALAPVADS